MNTCWFLCCSKTPFKPFWKCQTRKLSISNALVGQHKGNIQTYNCRGENSFTGFAQQQIEAGFRWGSDDGHDIRGMGVARNRRNHLIREYLGWFCFRPIIPDKKAFFVWKLFRSFTSEWEREMTIEFYRTTPEENLNFVPQAVFMLVSSHCEISFALDICGINFSNCHVATRMASV